LTETELRREVAAIRWTPAGDSKQFAAAALELADDAKLRQGFGAAARALYDRRFSWEVIASTLLGALPRSDRL
jgi:glycosyltransferase involved in cell wall biosynthesis